MDVTGQLESMASPYAARWDRPGYDGQVEDYGWIGSDASGVWLAVHPETALIEHPDVADIYERCRAGPEMTRSDLDALSAWEYTLAATFMAAWHRRVGHEAKGPK